MSKKILLIDDDLFIRELYMEVLRDEGFEVDTGVDGEEGLAKLKKGGYILVLLDIVMPKLDGLAVLDALTKISPLEKNGPVVLLTNLSQETIQRDFRSNRAASYLVKGELTPGQLVENVKKILANTSLTY